MKRYTIRFRYEPLPLKPLVIALAVLLVAFLLLWALIDVALPNIGFDGKFGPGCDKGNPNCHVSPNPEESKP